ncbi:RNase A-like domain-containing protein [Nocardioides sp. YIM 152315]|uniref:RNase A-like domain-containing protein n=1 Tax=Nocardioides sp. YIM 152315 TaxID=3031760 RepID=UPI0023DC2427|nr:RNase A-like domain-containing protein [Nocardioides sp. YIM 152315]MDF1604058.1 hypothetical protein [Nocardioides sp. YIM 152315]
MRVAVSEQAHASAVTALVDGNRLAAQASVKLADRLAAYAGMAGDDSTATEFASSYDDAAAASVAALESLVGALAALARLVEATGLNHAHADSSSVLPGWARPLVGPPTAASRTVGVVLPEPPSSRGSSASPPGGLSGLVLDALQDVFWPNADTDRVRSAASTWTAAAEALHLLTAHCDSASSALEDERSPETPLALGVVSELRSRVGDLTAQLGDLAAACTTYADHVDAKRHELVELLEDLAQELAIGAVAAGTLTFLSGGTALVAGSGAGAARVASASSKFRGILDSLRALTAATALQARPVAVTAGEVGAYTRKISRARVMLIEASGAGGKGTPLKIAAHEGANRGHTIAKHVGKSIEHLRHRAATHPTATRASTLIDERSADRAISRALDRHADEVVAWLRSGDRTKRLDAVLDEATGISVDRAGVVTEVKGIRIVLVRESSMPEGYWIKTAFPEP